MVGGIDILENPGVAGDLREDCELIDAISGRLEEFLRDPSDVVELDLPLREKRPMMAVRRIDGSTCVVKNGDLLVFVPCDRTSWTGQGFLRYRAFDKEFDFACVSELKDDRPLGREAVPAIFRGSQF